MPRQENIKGRYDSALYKLVDSPILTKEEELELTRRIKAGDEPVDRLVQHNLQLVLFLAKKAYVPIYSTTIEDLFQEGVLGLIRAAENSTPSWDLDSLLTLYSRLNVTYVTQSITKTGWCVFRVGWRKY